MNRSQKLTEHLIKHESTLFKLILGFLVIFEGIFFIFLLFASPFLESLFLVLTVIIVTALIHFLFFMFKLNIAPLCYYHGRYRKFLLNLSEKYPEIADEIQVEMDMKVVEV